MLFLVTFNVIYQLPTEEKPQLEHLHSSPIGAAIWKKIVFLGTCWLSSSWLTGDREQWLLHRSANFWPWISIHGQSGGILLKIFGYLCLVSLVLLSQSSENICVKTATQHWFLHLLYNSITVKCCYSFLLLHFIGLCSLF